MNFAFGAARRLYATGSHPRLMFGPDDVARLRSEVRRGIARTVMDALRTDVARAVEHVLSHDAARMIVEWSDWYDVTCRVLTGLDDLALVAVVDENERALEAVRRVLTAVPAADAAGQKALWHCGATVRLPLAYDLVAKRLPEADRETFTRWTVERPIRARLELSDATFYRRAGMNAWLSEVAVAILGILAVRGDPGAPPLDAELARCLPRLEASLNVALCPDGYPEEDAGYGTSFLGEYLSPAVEVLRRAGVFDGYEACRQYARAGRAILHYVQPWGECLANTGDCTTGMQNRQFALARLATETHDPALLWLIGRLPHQFYQLVPEVRLPRIGSIPAAAMTLAVLDDLRRAAPAAPRDVPTCFRDRRRGIVSLRSGWGDDDAFVVFDGSQRSPAAQGHFHDSCGHFSLSALGECFAIDTGRYCMEQSDHNVVLVDGRSGRSTGGRWMSATHHGRLIVCASGDFVDFASVDSSHQSDCRWAIRHLALVKGRRAPAYVWMVDDVNKDDGPHEFWWTLNTHPDNAISLQRRRAVIRGRRHGHALDVHFALPEPDEYPEPHSLALAQDVATCSSTGYVGDPVKAARKSFRSPADMIHRSVLWRPRLIATVRGLNGRFMSVLIPRRRGEPPARVSRLRSLPNSLAVRVTFPEIEDTVIFAYEHDLLEAGDVSRRGQWCVVRRSRRSGRMLDCALGGGRRLRVAGRSYPRPR